MSLAKKALLFASSLTKSFFNPTHFCQIKLCKQRLHFLHFGQIKLANISINNLWTFYQNV